MTLQRRLFAARGLRNICVTASQCVLDEGTVRPLPLITQRFRPVSTVYRGERSDVCSETPRGKDGDPVLSLADLGVEDRGIEAIGRGVRCSRTWTIS